jgi:hypothetical protein
VRIIVKAQLKYNLVCITPKLDPGTKHLYIIKGVYFLEWAMSRPPTQSKRGGQTNNLKNLREGETKEMPDSFRSTFNKIFIQRYKVAASKTRQMLGPFVRYKSK